MARRSGNWHGLFDGPPLAALRFSRTKHQNHGIFFGADANAPEWFTAVVHEHGKCWPLVAVSGDASGGSRKHSIWCAATTAVLPVWVCNLRRTLLRGPVHRHFVEIRIACWRQFHAMRAQAFNHATVFPKDPTAKLLHIRTARSSQGTSYYIMANGQAGRCRGCILRIFRMWGPSANRSPHYRGGQQQWVAAEALGS